MRARCVDGPYAGQTFGFPYPRKVHWYVPWAHRSHVGPLMWINYGTDRHCYQLVPMGYRNPSTWCLVFRDTF